MTIKQAVLECIERNPRRGHAVDDEIAVQLGISPLSVMEAIAPLLKEGKIVQGTWTAASGEEVKVYEKAA